MKYRILIDISTGTITPQIKCILFWQDIPVNDNCDSIKKAYDLIKELDPNNENIFILYK